MNTQSSETARLLQQRATQVPRGVAHTHPLFVARAQGAHLWDIEGNQYIDFTGGIGVQNIGHNHPRVIEAIQQQAQHFTHTCFQVAMYEPYLLLAERLNKLAPGSDAKKTLFLTTGAEAVENAIKIARAATRRSAVISFTHSFHGRTLLGMSLTGKATAYKQQFGPYAPEIYHAPYPYSYRGWDTQHALDALKELWQTQITPDQVAAIIIEPVLGEGGFVPAPFDFLQELRQLTNRYGILLIADEIQSGFGRTGKMFAIEHSGVVPDLITIAKSLAAGMPLSGVIGRADIMDAPQAGGLGGTYAGNPIACVAGLAVLDIFEEENLLTKAQILGSRLYETCSQWKTQIVTIGDVRGLGPMLGLEFVTDQQSCTPAPTLVDTIIQEAREQGLLLLKAGLYGNVLRLIPSLTVDDQTLEQALTILHTTLQHAAP